MTMENRIGGRKPLSYYLKNAIWHVDYAVPLPEFVDKGNLESWVKMSEEMEALLVESREYLRHNDFCQLVYLRDPDTLQPKAQGCTCGLSALLSQLNALLTPTPDQR